jgi:hypothetical protein
MVFKTTTITSKGEDIMGYEISLDRAWKGLEALPASNEYKVQFLCDIYMINLDDESVLCQSSGKPAEDYLAVLILHYLIGDEAWLQAERRVGPSRVWGETALSAFST